MSKAKRLAIRVTAEEGQLIRQAARSRGMSVSAFVVSSAREAAEHALSERTNFLGDERWEELERRLAEARRVVPAMRDLFGEPDLFA